MFVVLRELIGRVLVYSHRILKKIISFFFKNTYFGLYFQALQLWLDCSLSCMGHNEPHIYY